MFGRCVLPLLLLVPAAAYAHREPLPIEVWGNFGASAARCQRRVARAATRCVLAVWTARRECIESELSGGSCDADRTAAAVGRARERAAAAIERGCSDAEATAIQFLGRFEAIGDARRICDELETALVSAAFGPGVVVGGGDPPSRACVLAAAAVAQAAIRAAIREYRAPLDVIAGLPLDGAVRAGHMARAATRVERAGNLLAATLAERCPATVFEALYRRGAARFVTDVASRAACLAGGVYVQDAAVCPPAVCGNGMIEPGEECDDADGDECESDCVR